MSRLIDADKLEQLCDIMGEKCDGIGESIWNQFKTTVELSQTIDAVPVVHGYWRCAKGYDAPLQLMECSVCGKSLFGEPDLNKYCTYCGAKMDEVTENG